jgi:hypothetical protein
MVCSYCHDYVISITCYTNYYGISFQCFTKLLIAHQILDISIGGEIIYPLKLKKHHLFLEVINYLLSGHMMLINN